MASIFISHSSTDRRATERVSAHLRTAGYAALFVDFDPEWGIPAGRDWKRELYTQLRRADAVVFLASEASATSQWCAVEVGLAQSLGTPVFPVRLQPGLRMPLLDDLQWVNGADGQAGLDKLLDGLRAAGLDPDDSYSWDPRRSPYPGLAPFAFEDAAVFFGRERETARLVELLQPTLQRGAGRFVGVVGPSGSGKSSLLRAGLLPRLRRTPGRWVLLPPLQPGRQPTQDLVACLTRTFAAHGAPRSRDDLAVVLDEGSPGLQKVAEELSMTVEPAGGGAGRPNVLVVLDQAEELLTRTGPTEQHAFLDLVTGALAEDSPLWVVATVRSEYLSSAPDRAGLAAALDDTLVIEPLGRAHLAEVIVRPARRAGLEFAPGLVERMVQDTAGGDALPLLAHTLRELGERAGPDGRISIADYDAVGGVVGALRNRADRVADELGRRGYGELVVSALVRLATVTGEDEPTRRRVRRSTLTAEEQAVVDAFIDARLLTSDHAPAAATDQAPGDATVEVAHEALLRQWPPLREAIEADRTGLRLRSELERLAAEWERSNRDDAYLLRGARLATFDEWASTHPGDLGSHETAQSRDPERSPDIGALQAEFVRRSRVRQRRAVRRWRAVTAVLAVLMLAAATLTVVAINRGNALSEQLDAANAELLAQAALARAATDPVTSTQLALAAWRLDPNSPSARAALLRQYVAMRSVDGVVAGVAEQQIIAFTLSRDGRRMIQADLNGIVVTRLADGAPERHLLPGSPPLNAFLSSAASDRFVAAMDPAGTVLLWDLTTGGGPQTISGPKPAISANPPFMFSDAERLVWLEPAPGGAELRIWNVATNTPVPHGLGPIQEPNVVRVALTADLTRVMIQLGDTGTGRVNGPTFVRSLADGTLLSTLPEHTVLISDGVATCTKPGTDVTDPHVAVITGPDLVTPLRRLPLEKYGCADFDRMFTRDRGHLADRIGEQTDVDVVRIRDITDGSAYEVSLPPDPNTATDDSRWTVAQKMTVLPGPDGTRTVLVPHETSLLRLTAVPNPHIADELSSVWWAGQSDDGRTVVADVGGGGGFAAFDRGSGGLLAQLSEEDRGGGSAFYWTANERLTLGLQTEGGRLWVAEYSLPALEPVLRVELPARPGQTMSKPYTYVHEDRIYTLGDGLLTGWDRTRGALLGPPVDLATTPQRKEWFTRPLVIKGRPRHPGEVAVVAPPQNIIEIWDVERGTHVTTLPQAGGGWTHWFAFDAGGSRIASVTNTGALEVWDVDRGELAFTPIPIESAHRPVGIAADGTVVTAREAPGLDELLTFWDVAAGRAIGSVRLSALEADAEIVDGTHLDVVTRNGFLGGSALPHRMALTPQLWADALCRFSRRPFTDTELAALPEGSTIPPPC